MKFSDFSALELSFYDFEYLGPAIKQLVDDNGYTINQIVQSTGIPRSTLYHFLQGDRDLPSSRVFVLLKTLEMTPIDVIHQVKLMNNLADREAYLQTFNTEAFEDVAVFQAEIEKVDGPFLTEVLLNMSALITVSIDDLEKVQALQDVIVTVASDKLFNRIGRLTLTEMELFNNLIPYLNWPMVKSIYAELSRTVDDLMSQLETNTDLNYSSRLLAIVANATFNVVTRSLQEEDLAFFEEQVDVYQRRGLPYYDVYGRFVKTAFAILRDYRMGQIEAAHDRYLGLRQSLNVLFEDNQKIYYSSLLGMDFDEFVSQVVA
jgi:transcriptional regulator with XRE-family HTH domain